MQRRGRLTGTTAIDEKRQSGINARPLLFEAVDDAQLAAEFAGDGANRARPNVWWLTGSP
jgi:hypothetical protein